MTLLEFLVQELPKRGGWPAGASICERFLHESNIEFYDEKGNWPEDCGINYGLSFAEKLVQPRRYGKGLCTEVVKKEEYEAALAASKRPEWNGKDLPPVGCECELSNAVEFYTNIGSVDFEEGTIVVVGGVVDFGMPGFVAVKVKGSNCITDVNSCFLRPIRTEAERKREEVGLALYHAINWNAEGELVGPSRMEDYRKAYDAIAAGKIPGIKLAD